MAELFLTLVRACWFFCLPVSNRKSCIDFLIYFLLSNPFLEVKDLFILEVTADQTFNFLMSFACPTQTLLFLTTWLVSKSSHCNQKDNYTDFFKVNRIYHSINHLKFTHQCMWKTNEGFSPRIQSAALLSHSVRRLRRLNVSLMLPTHWFPKRPLCRSVVQALVEIFLISSKSGPV